MTDYQLTDGEILAVYNFTPEDALGITVTEHERGIADAASKKARNETNKEWRKWLEACGLDLTGQLNNAQEVILNGLAPLPENDWGEEYHNFYPPGDDPNRFCPKDI